MFFTTSHVFFTHHISALENALRGIFRGTDFLSLRGFQLTKKELPAIRSSFCFFRGAKQIRTAVDGFADRYLATRSWHHGDVCGCKSKK